MDDRERTGRELSRAEILTLPWPTAEQQWEFASHVCCAHSWYKYLSLMTGGEFVVFLAADAGGAYSAAHPRLHHTWQAAEEYRKRFGHLDYMWRDGPGEPFGRDAGHPVRLPSDLLEVARFTLFPFASNDLNATEACLWRIHDKGFEELRAGAPHPAGSALVLAWWESQMLADELWCRLSSEGQDLALESRRAERRPGECAASPAPLPPDVAEYAQLRGLADSVYTGLQMAERAKVIGAIGRLAALLLRWAPEEAGRGWIEPGVPRVRELNRAGHFEKRPLRDSELPFHLVKQAHELRKERNKKKRTRRTHGGK